MRKKANEVNLSKPFSPVAQMQFLAEGGTILQLGRMSILTLLCGPGELREQCDADVAQGGYGTSCNINTLFYL